MIAHSEGHAGNEIDDDQCRLALDVERGFVTGYYWDEGVRRDVVERSLANSLNLGLHYGGSWMTHLSMEKTRSTRFHPGLHKAEGFEVHDKARELEADSVWAEPTS